MNTIPTELANARIASNTAWDKYDAAIGTPFQAELWKVVNWLEERASSLYNEWQKQGGTSDIEVLSFATDPRNEYHIDAELFLQAAQEPIRPVFTNDTNCSHEKAYPTHGGMMCKCGAKFEPRNDFEKRLVAARNPRGNGYVNWQLR